MEQIKIKTFARGVEEAIKELKKKGNHVLRAAKVELKKGADDIVKDAKFLCPRSTSRGEIGSEDSHPHLRDSIKATAEKDGAIQKITASAKGSNGVDYSRYVEFDPRINKALDPRVKSKDTDPKLKRQLRKQNTAYMYPALKHNVKKIRKNIYTAIVNACRS